MWAISNLFTEFEMHNIFQDYVSNIFKIYLCIYICVYNIFKIYMFQICLKDWSDITAKGLLICHRNLTC